MASYYTISRLTCSYSKMIKQKFFPGCGWRALREVSEEEALLYLLHPSPLKSQGEWCNFHISGMDKMKKVCEQQKWNGEGKFLESLEAF